MDNIDTERVIFRAGSRRAIACAFLGLLAGVSTVAAPAFAQSPPALADDWARRSAQIHWPAGHTPEDADLFAHNELHIGTSCSTVWRHIVEAPKWPNWYPNAQEVRILGNLGEALRGDSQFSWKTFGLDVVSQIHEFAPE
uniref:hypothetical protein n=1 Tax=Inquilinus sp. OTU3971 TaxID=3043855 RepID=UPI00406D13FC